MTREETAVRKTVTMWEWLRDNPDRDKWGYLLKLKVKERPISAHNCYLCDIWVGDCGSRLGYSSNCPLDTKTLHCYNDNSPYQQWKFAVRRSSSDAAKQAQRILNANKRWLKKHGKQTKWRAI